MLDELLDADRRERDRILAALRESDPKLAARFGADHPANVPTLNNLGALDLRMGRLSDAKRIYLAG